jgi:cytoskeletal protein CcmA (bactofilin family)
MRISAAPALLVSLLLALPACASVNKSIEIDAGDTSDGASTVNGKIAVGAGATVRGDVSSVNGSIRIDEGATVADAEPVNGDIELERSEVRGDVSTTNGDVELAGGAVIMGDLIIEKPSGWSSSTGTPRIIIGPGSRVEGVIRLEREVKLFISDSAEVGGVEGEMSMDDAVRFSGKRP